MHELVMELYELKGHLSELVEDVDAVVNLDAIEILIAEIKSVKNKIVAQAPQDHL